MAHGTTGYCAAFCDAQQRLCASQLRHMSAARKEIVRLFRIERPSFEHQTLGKTVYPAFIDWHGAALERL